MERCITQNRSGTRTGSQNTLRNTKSVSRWVRGTSGEVTWSSKAMRCSSRPSPTIQEFADGISRLVTKLGNSAASHGPRETSAFSATPGFRNPLLARETGIRTRPSAYCPWVVKGATAQGKSMFANAAKTLRCDAPLTFPSSIRQPVLHHLPRPARSIAWSRGSLIFSWEMSDLPHSQKLPPACRAEASNFAEGQLHSLPHAEKVRSQHKPCCFDGPSHPSNPLGKSAHGRCRTRIHRQFDLSHSSSPRTGRKTRLAGACSGLLRSEPGLPHFSAKRLRGLGAGGPRASKRCRGSGGLWASSPLGSP